MRVVFFAWFVSVCRRASPCPAIASLRSPPSPPSPPPAQLASQSFPLLFLCSSSSRLHGCRFVFVSVCMFFFGGGRLGVSCGCGPDSAVRRLALASSLAHVHVYSIVQQLRSIALCRATTRARFVCSSARVPLALLFGLAGFAMHARVAVLTILSRVAPFCCVFVLA